MDYIAIISIISSVITVVSFVAGLALGLHQLNKGQRQFEVQQNDKMDEIRKSLTEIEKNISTLQQVTSQHSNIVQVKLIDHITKQSQNTANDITQLVKNTLALKGIDDEQTINKLEHKVQEIVEDSTSSIVGLREDEESKLTRREQEVLDYLKAGKTSLQIAEELMLQSHTVRGYMSKIYGKFKVNSLNELLSKLNDEND